MLAYVAGWNQPGFLPEEDPQTFVTEDDAIQYLENEIEEWILGMNGTPIESRSGFQLRKVLDQLQNKIYPGFSGIGAGYEWWIHEYSEGAAITLLTDADLLPAPNELW